ncbi:squalene synthase HpnC [Roseomonas gilardii]|uniref:Squalene synthase HpnC n=1 Tax=Roseomonas gilardii TaxID=257708 RepID=A0ABU3MF28_9PROT|nr:squalene synthase HpnC [Roseomonas gilardii]MDT8331573.1 squalene synthase HpnC [Roseomonas gilardii]PZR16503.1 MAG: squalene synthase HpnC [Azospirillum brasilense]
MTQAADLASGKGSGDENFPVASHLVSARHRPAILAFYRFARIADDVADHPTAAPAEKLEQLARMERGLRGETGANPEGEALHRVLRERGLDEQHPLDLLEAFRRDVTRLRYADWAELMDYCRYSASPVGRFVLDVHGESRALWPRNDALCSALQVINHLQDCAKDRRNLDRVYLPQDLLERAGIGVEALDAPAASPALRGVIATLAEKTAGLLDASRAFSTQIQDLRLSVEVGVIQKLAESLTIRLLRRDPLAERVHHRRAEALGLALLGAAGTLGTRWGWFSRKGTGPDVTSPDGAETGGTEQEARRRE